MAQKRQNYKRVQQNNTKSAYVNGSAVKKLYVAQPVREPDVEQEQREQQKRRRQNEQRKIHRANKLNFLYTVGVSVIVAAIFGICIQYLNLQSTVKSNASEVAQLQAQLYSLQETNNETQEEINAGINLDKIYEAAVNELGMRYPNQSQVRLYESSVSEYVKQYQDIPEAE